MRFDVDSIDNRDRRAIERTVAFLEPLLEKFFHPVVRGLERIPAGPGLYVANHNGGVLFPDAYVLGATIYRRCGMEDLPYVLAHDMAVRTPIANEMMVPLGGVRASPENAHKLFAANRKVLVFPGGDVEALRPYRDRDKIVFGERRGYVRLAIQEGVPIIPSVTAGAHSGLFVLDDGGRVARFLGIDRSMRVKVCPIVISVPWGLTIGFPPPYVPVPTRMFMEILEPIAFDRSGPEAANDREYVEQCHQRVVGAMQDALTRLARERRDDKRARHVRRLDALASKLGLDAPVRDALERLAIATHLTPAPAEAPAPETPAPETSASETSAPETSASETSASETSAPEPHAPEPRSPEPSARRARSTDRIAKSARTASTSAPDDDLERARRARHAWASLHGRTPQRSGSADAMDDLDDHAADDEAPADVREHDAHVLV
ncbi:MAG: acyltransferase family protein [Myxococcota bacterium]|nr:acyltransferase family protein [Myxococcota bacterium]